MVKDKIKKMLSRLMESQDTKAKASMRGTISARVIRKDGSVEDLGKVYDSKEAK